RMAPDRLPVRQPPGFTYRPGCLAGDSHTDRGPESGPLGIDHFRRRAPDQHADPRELLHLATTAGAAGRVRGRPATGARPERAIDEALEAGATPETSEARHHRKYTS